MSKIWEATEIINSGNSEDLTKTFNLCDATGLGPNSQSELFLYGLEGLPQLNYPYAINDMPGWPVQSACDILTSSSSDTLIEAAAKVTGMALSYDLKGDCFETLDEGPGNVPGDGPGSGPWGYQSCTETLHLFNSRGPADGGIREYNLDMSVIEEICKDSWGEFDVQPNTNALTDRYGGYKLGDGLVDVSNIIWSVGDIDPWGGGCFHPEYAKDGSEDDGLYYFVIEKGAHHYDLRGEHENDTDSVREVREKERDIIKGWIQDFV